jgi:hypothetical protein
MAKNVVRGVNVSDNSTEWTPDAGGSIEGVYTSQEGSHYFVRDDEGTVWDVSERSAPGAPGWIGDRFKGVATGERVICILVEGTGDFELRVL